MIQAKINYMKNEINDELYTPIYAITPLLTFLPKDITIWECTDYGYSNITKVLKEVNYLKILLTYWYLIEELSLCRHMKKS